MEEYDPDAPSAPAVVAGSSSGRGSLELEQEAAELAATAEAHAAAVINTPRATEAERVAPAATLSSEAKVEAQMAAAEVPPPAPPAPPAAQASAPAPAAGSRPSSTPSAAAAPQAKPAARAPKVPPPNEEKRGPRAQGPQPGPKLPRSQSEARAAAGAGARSELLTGKPVALKASASAGPLKPAAKPKPPAKARAPPQPHVPHVKLGSLERPAPPKPVFMPRQRAVAATGPAGALVEAPRPARRSPARAAQGRVAERAAQARLQPPPSRRHQPSPAATSPSCPPPAQPCRPQALAEAQHEQWQRALMSEWLTQHPLVLRYPPHIWLHADCPQPEGEGGGGGGGGGGGEMGPDETPISTPDASPQRQQVQYSNKLAIVYLQSGELDKARHP